MKYLVIKKAIRQAKADQHQVQETVRSILEKVHQEGDRALAYYEKKFDNYEPETLQGGLDE
jgi:histidinol dehydrogenase